MDEGIFSTYRQGENRVTASILAVLRSLSLPRIEAVIQTLLREPEFQLIRFENQIAGLGGSVPDAEITSSCRILVETKTKRNSLNLQQLEAHLQKLSSSRNERLLVLTPDQSEPPVVGQIADDRLVWSSFADLDRAIDKLLDSDDYEVVSEREEFLLRELQKMLQADQLLAPFKDVVVVAARKAWPEYESTNAYICQRDRTFQQVQYIAFYSEGRIQRKVARIQHVEQNVVFERNRYTGELGRLVENMLNSGRRELGDIHQVFLLSSPEDSANTVSLPQCIENEFSHAFVQGQRYVSLAALRSAKVTSELSTLD